jgi:hypothetical protein
VHLAPSTCTCPRSLVPRPSFRLFPSHHFHRTVANPSRDSALHQSPDSSLSRVIKPGYHDSAVAPPFDVTSAGSATVLPRPPAQLASLPLGRARKRQGVLYPNSVVHRTVIRYWMNRIMIASGAIILGLTLHLQWLNKTKDVWACIEPGIVRTGIPTEPSLH